MKGQFLIKCDFSYSCAAADKISTDLRARAVSLRQLSYLLIVCQLACHGVIYGGLICFCSRIRHWIFKGVT